MSVSITETMCILSVAKKSVSHTVSKTNRLGFSNQEATESLRASLVCKSSGGTDPTDIASLCGEEDDGSVKVKKHFSWWEPEHNENECRDSPPRPDNKNDLYRIGQCAAVEEDPESNLTEPSGDHLEKEGQAC